MPAKLIFYISPNTREETARFCPLVDVGCADCFLPKACNGEADENVAFRLLIDPGLEAGCLADSDYRMEPISTNARKEAHG